jgi:uncharacterized protein
MTAMPDTQIDWSKGLAFMAGPYFVGLYQPSPETIGFWEGVAANELRVKRCRTCNHLSHPKRIVCTQCGESELEWIPVSGKGEIYSFSEVHRAPTPAFASSVPYAVGVVRLAEGVYLFTRLFADPGRLEIGVPVRCEFRVLELGQKMPVFIVEGR